MGTDDSGIWKDILLFKYGHGDC